MFCVIKFWLFAVLWSAFSFAYSQALKYWVFFQDKPHATPEKMWVSPACLKNRKMLGLPLYQETDVTLYEPYCEQVAKWAQVVVHSRWLNALSVCANKEQIFQIRQLPFVKQVLPIRRDIVILRNNWHTFFSNEEYSTAMKQVEAEAFKKAGLNGEGVTIGVIDAGFYEASLQPHLKAIFEENRILGIRDYLTPQRQEHFLTSETNSDGHGTTVLQMIAGKTPDLQKGLAYKASFYLARTDHGTKEYRGEEDLWIAAMEWMDSMGVRLINTSLGYALRHDDPSEDYQPSHMDGQTTTITKAAQIAADQKGILLVVSAGNEGNERSWLIVSAPADAKGVLSVGATEENFSKADYSSIGPSFLPYLKPNVACFSRSGTSFSAPVITGFAACLMQKKPQATAKEIFEIIEKSANLYPYGNNFIGYGVPNCQRALDIMEGKKIKQPLLETKFKKRNVAEIRINAKGLSYGVVFHKVDERNVLEQSKVRGFKGKFKIEKPSGARFSTFVVKQQVIEIEW